MSTYDAITDKHTADIMFNNLKPKTSYGIYCATISSEGVVMKDNTAQSDSQDIIPVVKTGCCKQIVVDVLKSEFIGTKSHFGLLTLFTDHAPSDLLIIQFVLVLQDDSNDEEDIFYSIFPLSLTLDGQHGANMLHRLSVQPTDAGVYDVQVILSGPSADEYEIDFIRGSVVTVLALGIPPSTPYIYTVRFSDDGTHLLVDFDSESDRANMFSIFTCIDLVDFPGANNSQCQWNSDQQLIVYPQSEVNGIQPNIGDAISILSEKIKAKCVDISSALVVGIPCDKWEKAPVSTKNILPPLKGIQPQVSISAPILFNRYSIS